MLAFGQGAAGGVLAGRISRHWMLRRLTAFVTLLEGQHLPRYMSIYFFSIMYGYGYPVTYDCVTEMFLHFF
jgi:hypothetical protein